MLLTTSHVKNKMDKENGLVSIIIPIHNSQHFLEKCLDSIKNQTYKFIELILIDDASTDESGIICENFKMKAPHLKTKIIKNLLSEGASGSRNKGLDFAEGEYIVFIDSDDYIDKTYIEDLVRKIEHNKADIELFSYYREDENGYIERGNENYPDKLFRLDNNYDFFAYYAHRGVWSCMFRRSIIYQDNMNHLIFNEKIVIGEDLLFYTEALSRAEKVHFTTECSKYHYVIHPGSTYSSMDLKKAYTAIEAYKKVVTIFENLCLEKAATSAKKYLVFKLHDLLGSFKQINIDENLYNSLKKEIQNLLPFVLLSVGGIKFKIKWYNGIVI